MSIAVTAPEKFDFQDLVCVALAFRFWADATARLHVEPKGGEDAILGISTQSPIETVEIQVKGSGDLVELETLLDCLLHFPERAAKGCLLERLLADQNRQVVLVMSGRCDDTAAKFVVSPDWCGTSHPSGHILVRDADQVLAGLAALATAAADLTPLAKRRKKRIAELADQLKSQDLRKALERLVVLERVSAASLQSEIAESLREDFRVPSDSISLVTVLLREAIKACKASHADAFPALRSIMSATTEVRLSGEHYILRGDEDRLEAALVADRAILLSGRPRTGKSETARYLASRMQFLGYRILEETDIEAAERFLLDPDGRDRLVYLDDPLGGITPVRAASRIFDRLMQLIPRLPINRKLIVAQSQEQLLATTRCASIADLGDKPVPWHDIGIVRTTFSPELWASLRAETDFPDNLGDQVSQSLRNGTLVLEPGCLSHLAANGDRAAAGGGLQSAIRVAREDARSLARALAEIPDVEAIVGAMAIGSRPGIPIADRELAFILGEGGGELPSLPPKDVFLGMALGGDEPVPAPPPEYSSEPRLTPAMTQGLEQLEKLRCVTLPTENHFAFAHPFYLAAAEHSLDTSTNSARSRLHFFVQRALFSNTSVTSRAAAWNLDWIFDRAAGHKETQTKILILARDGLRSDFPATRDICLDFLIRHIAAIPADDRNLAEWTRAATHIDLNSLLWVDGEARFPSRDEGKGRDYVLRMLETVPKDEIAPVIAALEGGGACTPEIANRALLYFGRHADELSELAMQRLLSFEDAFIRAQAVRIWFEEDRSNDSKLLDRIFADTHPSIADATLLGTIEGWAWWTASRREAVVPRIGQLATAPAAAALMLHRLEVFNRPEYSGEDPPWDVFGLLLPIIMRSLPIGAFVNDARLYAAVRDSRHQLPPNIMVSICDGWIDWIEVLVKDGQLPPDYTLGVVDLLIPATAANAELRAGRIARLLCFESTGVLLVFIKDLIDEWPHLSGAERRLVTEKLSEDRPDQRWLRAVVLLRHNVPEELQQLILGPTLRLNADPQRVFSDLDPEMLASVLAIECGHPGVFWQLGIHHTNTDLWPAVLLECLKDSHHPQFELALENAIFAEDDELIAASIQTAHKDSLERLFALLKKQRAIYTGNWLPKSWVALLSLAPDLDTKQRWYKELAENAYVLVDSLSDLRWWLIDETDCMEVLKQLPGDFAARVLIHKMGEILDEPAGPVEAKIVVDGLNEILKESSPKLHGTCSEIETALNRYEIRNEGLAAAIENRRLAILDDVQNARKLLRLDDVHQEPEHWVDPI